MTGAGGSTRMSGRAALRLRLARWIRDRAAGALALAAAAAVLGTVVLVLAAGAARTASAPDRYQQAFATGADLVVTQEAGAPITAEIAGLASVAAVRTATFVFVGGRPPASEQWIDAIGFAGDPVGIGAQLAEGRLPDPSSTSEFAATRSAVADSGLSLGDTVSFVSITPDDLAAYGFDIAHANGPRWDAELVGLLTVPSEFDQPTPVLLFSGAMLSDPSIANATTLLAVNLSPDASADDLRAELDQIPGGNALALEPAATVSDEVRTAVRGQSIGLWILAGLSALATVATIGFLVGRSVRVSGDERTSLTAIGYTPNQIVGESTARAGIVLGVALTLALGLAIALSGLFPVGFAADIEPSPGLRLEPLVLAGGISFLLAGGLGWAALSTLVVGRSSRVTRVNAGEPLAAKVPWATAATGIRLAFARLESSGSFLTPIAGLVLAFAAFVGAATFGASLDRLIDEPARYGAAFDLVIDNGSDTLPADHLAFALASDDVRSVERYRSAGGRIGGETGPVMTSESLRGDGSPVVLAGRLPSGDDEVAIGGVTQSALGVGLGDTIAVSVDGPTVDVEVVGTVITPSIRGYDQLGVGAYVDQAAFAALGVSVAPESATIQLEPTADADAARADISRQLGVEIDDLTLAAPETIVNLERIAFVPTALAVLLLALTGITAAASLWAAVRRRSRQLVILRTIGAQRGWLCLTGVWHAVAFMALPIVAGCLIGLVVGRTGFRRLAQNEGVVPDPTTPWVAIAVAIVGLIGLSVVVALVAGRRSRLGSPGRLLRAE